MTPISFARRRAGLTLSALAAASAVLLTACETVPVYHDGYGQPMYGSVNVGVQPNPVYVQSMPPAPIYEVQPAIPFAGAIWIGGNYVWRNNNWAWERGRWEAPRPGYAWQAPHYAPRPGGGATYVPGHWAHPGRTHVAPMQPVLRPVPPQPQAQPQYIRPLQPLPPYTRPVPPQPSANTYYQPNHVTPSGVVPPSAHNRPMMMPPQVAPQPAVVQQPPAVQPSRHERRDQMQQRRDEWQQRQQQRPLWGGPGASMDNRP